MKKALPKTNRPAIPKGGVKKDIRVTVKPKTGGPKMEFTISEDKKKTKARPVESEIEQPIKKKKKKVRPAEPVEQKKPGTALVPVLEI
ncbi:MAG: hypothetical protein ABSA33_05240, partial [Candidatus Micrarchaeaceae archaeon]